MSGFFVVDRKMHRLSQPNTKATMVLYKYMPKQYLDAFFKRGSLKIGTLYEYRKVEKYGSAIGDDAEGTSITKFRAPASGQVDLGGNSLEAQYLRNKFGFVASGPGAIIKFVGPDAEFNYRAESNDAYIYCTTNTYDHAVMQEFGGSCIEIIKPREFFKAISHAIRHKGEFQHHGPIEYKDRETDWRQPHRLHECMIKDPQYAYQNEMRAIWAPMKATISPLFINVPTAVKFCRPFTHRNQ